jgi:hypothetical protein
MMSYAAFRQPPFSAGENEKGFRDALIAEAAGQLIESSSNCRIAIVTGDELLTKALLTRMTGTEHVDVLSSIEELKGLINTLVSNVDEGFIQKMKAAAASFFFEQGNQETYMYKQKIKETILRDFSQLASCTTKASSSNLPSGYGWQRITRLKSIPMMTPCGGAFTVFRWTVKCRSTYEIQRSKRI